MTMSRSLKQQRRCQPNLVSTRRSPVGPRIQTLSVQKGARTDPNWGLPVPRSLLVPRPGGIPSAFPVTHHSTEGDHDRVRSCAFGCSGACLVVLWPSVRFSSRGRRVSITPVGIHHRRTLYCSLNQSSLRGAAWSRMEELRVAAVVRAGERESRRSVCPCQKGMTTRRKPRAHSLGQGPSGGQCAP